MAKPGTSKLRVHDHPGAEPVAVEVAPDQTFVPLEPKNGVCVLTFDLVKAGDFFRPVARAHERHIRMTEDMCVKLGLGISYRTLRRLVVGGFVDGVQVTPGTYTMSLASYYEHVERVRNDPDFWDREENKRRWRDALNDTR